jgi:acyl-coenzyme A thioesterase PaaI-like protein
MNKNTPLQDIIHTEAPIRQCYGCGSDNPHGMQIKSFLEGDEAVSHWRAKEHHCSYPGFLNGGVACTLIDCHSAWAAFSIECRDKGLDFSEKPDLSTGWTRAMSVEFLKPVPLSSEVTLRARVIKKGRTSRTVACSLFAEGNECVRAEVTLVMS